MAIVINCAQDWTYDQYVEALEKYDATHEDSSDYVGYFVGYMKRSVDRFLSRWNAKHDGKLYAAGYGWSGDEFACRMMDGFSDFYKDAFGQRPHLPVWYYVHPLGLPMSEDTARLFCADPVEEAVRAAKEVRESWSD